MIRLKAFFCFAISFFVVFSRFGVAQAQTCLEVFRAAASEQEPYTFEIQLAEEIEHNFREAWDVDGVALVANSILKARDTHAMDRMNKLADRYYSRLAKMPQAQPKKVHYRRHELLITLVIDYFDGTLCGGEPPLTRGKYLRNYFAFLSRSANPVLNAFGKREREREILLPKIHEGSFDRVGLSYDEIDSILDEAAEPPYKRTEWVGFRAFGTSYYLPKRFFNNSSLIKDPNPEDLSSQMERSVEGGFFVVESVPGLDQSKIQSGFRGILSHIESSTRYLALHSGRVDDDLINAIILSDYLGSAWELFWEEDIASYTDKDSDYELWYRLKTEEGAKTAKGPEKAFWKSLVLDDEAEFYSTDSWSDQPLQRKRIQALCGMAALGVLPKQIISNQYLSDLSNLLSNNNNDSPCKAWFGKNNKFKKAAQVSKTVFEEERARLTQASTLK